MRSLIISVILISSAHIVISQSINPQLFLSNILGYLSEYLAENDLFSSNNTLNLQEGVNRTNSTNEVSLVDSLKFLTDLYTQLKILQNATKMIGSIENECTLQLAMFVDGLLNMDNWAVRMFDATAKVQPGFLEGNLMQMGHYDECMAIDVVVNGTQINGKYCSAAFIESGDSPQLLSLDNEDDLLRLKMSYGFCVPTACNKTSLEEVARILGDALKFPIGFQFFDELCDSAIISKPFSVATILSLVFFTAIGIIIVLSTLYDIYAVNRKVNEASLFTAFSFYTNGKKLFSTKAPANTLECLNGMRVISMMWIVGGHRFMYSSMIPMINTYFVLELPEKMESTLVTACNMAVDTFFLISGLLIVYVYLNHKEKGQSTPISMFYFHRILRLTPPLAAVVLFYATLLKHIGSGPLWPIVNIYFQKNCETNWWSTLLYLQNYIHNSNDTCVSHAWYLAVDTQLYFLSPLLLLPLMKWPKRTILGILILIFLCITYTFEITWQKQLGNAFYGLGQDMMMYIYSATHARAAPWLLGIILGYIIFQYRNEVIKIHKGVIGLLWLLSISTMLGIILFHHRLVEATLLEYSLFNSLARTAWSLGLSVIIFLCVTGHGGVINTFLSCSIFRILIRLNYNMYLLHISVIIFLVGQTRTPEYVSIPSMFYLFWGDFAITLCISTVWTLAFESPILVLEKLIFGKTKKPATAQRESKVINNNIDVIVIEDKLANGTDSQTKNY